MMHALKLSGDVAQSCSFETLTPDMTRFLLKQKEKQIQDENSDGKSLAPRSCSFETLTPDMTRFLLKQKEKQIQDENSDGVYQGRVAYGEHFHSAFLNVLQRLCPKKVLT